MAGERSLQEILQEAYNLKFGSDVRQALLTRMELRKKIKSGKVDLKKLNAQEKALVLNAMQSSPEAEAEFALKQAKEKEARRVEGENRAFQQMEIADPVLRRKANPFGVVDAAKNLQVRKDRALFQ